MVGVIHFLITNNMKRRIIFWSIVSSPIVTFLIYVLIPYWKEVVAVIITILFVIVFSLSVDYTVEFYNKYIKGR
jgi:uncharacterized membrane protein HdeD (DUF308 family)